MNKIDTVVISRHWNNPHIKVVCTDASISLAIPLDDYLHAYLVEAVDVLKDAVTKEIGNPTALFTKGAIKARVDNAITPEVMQQIKDKVRLKIQQESSRVVA